MSILEIILVAIIVLMLAGFSIIYFRTKKAFLSIIESMYDNCKIYGNEIMNLKNSTSQNKNSLDIIVKDHKTIRNEIHKINNAMTTFNNGFAVPASTMDV